MRIKYNRISTISQNPSRQELNSNEYDKVFLDKVSGTIPFFERENGKIILELLEEGKLESMSVQSIDRLGRNLKSTLDTIDRFLEFQVPIYIENMGIWTINQQTKKTDYSINLMISVLSLFSQLENEIRRERQMEGIRIAQKKGKFQGRKKGTKESIQKFLNKPKNKRALELLESDSKLSYREVARACNLHYNSVSKLAKVYNQFQSSK